MHTSPDPESLHPSLWRASQLGRTTGRCINTGHPALRSQLPGGGWPIGSLIELLQQPGSGELRLLRPALAAVAARGVALVRPPHVPQALALAALGIAPERLVWINAARGADALWATEQILKSNCQGAVMLWADHARPENLRRLHLAAQQSDTLFCLLRPLAAAQDASPAPLRLAVRPAQDGVNVTVLKRKGPARDEPVFVAMSAPVPHHAPLVQPIPAPATARSLQPNLVR